MVAEATQFVSNARDQMRKIKAAMEKLAPYEQAVKWLRLLTDPRIPRCFTCRQRIYSLWKVPPNTDCCSFDCAMSAQMYLDSKMPMANDA